MSADCDSIAVRRSRREKKQSGATSALEKIRRSRETGVHEEAELEAPRAVFDYVDEDEYARIVQERQEEGFVLDDDGGYSEHGREIFDEEVDPVPKSKRGEGAKKPGVMKRVAKPTNIKTMLMSRGDAGKKRKKEESASLKDDAVLSDILKQMEEGPSVSVSGGVGRRHKLVMSTPPVVTPRRPPQQLTPRQSSTPHPARHSSRKKIRVVRLEERQTVKQEPSPPPSPPASLPFGDDEWCDEWEGDVPAVVGEGEGVTEVKEEEGEPMEVEEKPVVPEAAVSTGGWETVREELPQTQETLSSVQVDSSSLPTKEIDGEEVLPFFWLDAYEDSSFHQQGTVYLFGKVWVPAVNTHVSCCVVVKNMDRCLYFLPREKMLGKNGKPTDKDVTFEDVYREFQERYAEPCRMMRFTSKRVTRRYAFDRPDVPRESEYLEVQYSTQYPAPPMNTSGQTFSHVFGTNTSSLERLVIKCGLKGPCWLNIKQPVCPSQPVSWCKCEAVVGGMKSVSVMVEQAPPPSLVVVSLSLKIILNPKNGTNEVLCVGALIHPSFSLDKPPPKTTFEADFCTIRRPVDRDFPFRFEEHVKKKGFNIEIASSERAMLAYFLAKLHRIDPDIVVGHNLSSLELQVLQHRMAACKVPQWSRIGRLKRKDMPKGHSASFALCAGRPVCDVKTSAKELIRAKSYDLPELVSTVLHEKHASLDHEDILKAFGCCEHLGNVIAHTMDEAMLSLRLIYELNVLPLAYQITCIAGNVFGRTLMGGRAERNEFLLLHAFTAKDYICPDKHPFGKKHQQLAEQDADEGEPLTKGKRKPAYSGGLVLEPKRGFYDRYILLLDFNSLYPSIMQEYNICFTTLDHAHCPPGEEGLATLKLLDPSEPLGVLPSEIRVLVERRRQVKQLMKGAQGKPEQYQQYDIRQKALKLTANSMYGCLGFANSRFHAKPLAALITSKGREILSHTKELAQKLNLDVIYGDTDSIMIDSNTRDLAEAERIAQRVKLEVNKLYRLLEIDVDGIFKSMLLLKKKKYAAVAVEWRDGHQVERREVKGLDIVRRDWCGLAKTSGHYVLDQILSGDPLDEVIEKIQTYLRQVREDVVGGKVPLEQFAITKSLTKPPADYPDKKNLPHVQVALRMMSRNMHVQAGDVIPYIMCQGDSSQSAALRAYHPDEVGRQEHLKVDTQYYLQHQLQAVVSRLCEPIEGLDAAQIAECLGLDPSSYRSSASRQDDEGHGEEMLRGGEGQLSGAKPLFVQCPHCQRRVKVRGSKCPIGDEGLHCEKCRTPLGVGRVMNQLTLTVRVFTKKYYAGWLVCEDHSCRYRTRHPTISLEEAGPRCPSCHQGKLIEEYPASALYRQLISFQKTFTLKNGSPSYQRLKTHMTALLSHNQYSKVKLDRLFPGLG